MKFLLTLTEENAGQIFDMDAIVEKAKNSLNVAPPHITDNVAALTKGGIHDYYSNADYWWPDPRTENGLPFVLRDGETNPENFTAHRGSLRAMRTSVADLTAAYIITKDVTYADKAVVFLKEFFLDAETKMNPHLLYAQAIPGVCDGRGIGIIDTLHLIDIPVAIDILKNSVAMPGGVYDGLQKWFSDYLHWMTTHEYGIDEMNTQNNHSVCWTVQASVFARFTGNKEMLAFCRNRFTGVLLPEQMEKDGSFPLELKRTNPYNYSCFVADNMANICNILSTPSDNLWEYTTPDGKCMKKAVEFITPFMCNINTWPYKKDIQHFEEFPSAMPFLLFAGLAYKRDDLCVLWKELSKKNQKEEIRRNIAVRQPFIWLTRSENLFPADGERPPQKNNPRK
jgi:hypothetical protein